MTVRLPLVIGFARAMELIITGRRIDSAEALSIGLVNEVVPAGGALDRAQALAREIAALPQGAIRSDKESLMRGVGRTLEERIRIETELIVSMFHRRDAHTIGAAAFKERTEPSWRHHGL
jgi:enoyl-CoA hydratase